MSKFSETPKIEHARKREFTPVPADFGADVNEDIRSWLHEHLRVYKESYQNLFESKVPEWRRLAEGKPKDKTKSFPWPNASNLVVQVIGQRIDDMAARVLALIWMISPVAVFRYFAKIKDPHEGAKKARLLQEYIDNQAWDSEALDLYRVESAGFSDSARLGTHFFKIVPERRQEVTEASILGSDPQSKRTQLTQSTTFNGPKVENLEFEHVLGDPQAATWEKSRLKCSISQISRHDLQERVYAGAYDKESVDKILDHPDRHGPEFAKQRQQSKKGVMVPASSIMAEWDIYECNFWWLVKTGEETTKVHLYCSYHYHSRTMVRQVFNFMPDNACAIIPTKLDIASKGIHGRGYADMLEAYQTGISTMHNQRIDARTMAITGILRSSSPQIDKNIKVYPFCVIPADKDEVELIKNQTDIGDGGMADEAQTLRLADERAGIDPAIFGLGAGGFNKKGSYGSMGTLALIQAGNSRTNLRLSDFRHTHIKIITLCAKLYGKMGVLGAQEMFGEDAPLLEQALDDFAAGRIKIPIRAATASVNKEIEKQNTLMLKNVLGAHFQEQAKLIQAIESATVPPDQKEWMRNVVKSQDSMMMSVLREFAFDQPHEYVPEIAWKQGEQNANTQATPGAIGPEQLRTAISMARARRQPGGGVPLGELPGLPPAADGLETAS